MYPRVTAVRYLQDYCLELTFADSQSGKIDLAPRILHRAGVFTALHDQVFFKQVRVDPEAGTIIWPNDVDLDPDVLYCEAMGIPLPETRFA
jgi:hypothetical protein